MSSNDHKIKKIYFFFEPKAKFTYSLSESVSEEVSDIATDILNILLEANF